MGQTVAGIWTVEIEWKRGMRNTWCSAEMSRDNAEPGVGRQNAGCQHTLWHESVGSEQDYIPEK